METPRLLLATSLKMYLSAARTRQWLTALASISDIPQSIEIAALPTFPLLPAAAGILAGTPVRWGAQNLAPSEEGAQTGEVSARLLAEIGCRYVEIGHAERRRLFGEDDEVVAAKVGVALDAGLSPLLCVGEPDPLDPTVAAEAVVGELGGILRRVEESGRTVGNDLVVAYEPVWAIGAQEPAPEEHVTTVTDRLRDALWARSMGARVIYGGAAGPGSLTALWPHVDGLFLGRFAHDVGAVASLVAEASILLEG